MRQLSWLAKQLKDNAPQESEEDLPKPAPAPTATQANTTTGSGMVANSSVPGSPSSPGNPDPRPDLAADHVLWVTLLFVARRMDPYIRGLLWCTRYLGAGAEYDGKAIRIIPGQVSPEDYAQIRAEWMQPHRGRIIRVLEEAARTLQQAGVTGAVSGIKSTAQPAQTAQPDIKEVTPAAGRPQEPKVVQATLL